MIVKLGDGINLSEVPNEVIISIIVPVYNVEKYLNRCVDSILSQTFNKYEIILVNDGSTDSSGMLCDEYEKKYKFIKVIHKSNGGLGSARNVGLNNAIGKLIGFVDSDDWIEEDMYQHMFEIYNNTNCQIVSTRYDLVYNDKANILKLKYDVKLMSRDEALIHYLEKGIGSNDYDYSVCTKLYEKAIFDEIRFPENQLYEDAVTNFKLICKSTKYAYSNKVCYHYFQKGVSITRNKFSSRDFDLEKIGNQLVEEAKLIDNPDVKKLAKIFYARIYFSMLSKLCRFGTVAEIDEIDTINYLKNKLKINASLLYKSSMQLNRKIVLTIFIINPFILYYLFNIKRIFERDNNE